MRRLIPALAALATLSTGSVASAATLMNGGFESELTGWTVIAGKIDVVSSTPDALSVDYTPPEGDNFVRLTAGEPDEAFTILIQEFTVDTAFQITGFAAFLGFDYFPYDDSAYIKITGLSGQQLLYTNAVSLVGDFASSGWRPFQSDVLGAGHYILSAWVNDAFEPGYSSQLLMDGLSIQRMVTGVPEPMTWLLLITGFGVVGGQLRARRRGLSAA